MNVFVFEEGVGMDGGKGMGRGPEARGGERRGVLTATQKNTTEHPTNNNGSSNHPSPRTTARKISSTGSVISSRVIATVSGGGEGGVGW